MIRKAIFLLLVSAGVASCASGKVQNAGQTYPPAQFSIDAVLIDNATSPKAQRGFVRLLRKASENSRDVYNAVSGSNRAVYNLELTLNTLQTVDAADTVRPVTDNVISLTATVRERESGIAMRTLPVTYQLVAIDAEDTVQRQLIRGVVPAAFNGLYGMRSTPAEVRALIRSDALFGDAAPAAATRPLNAAPASPPAQPAPTPQPEPVSVETQSDGGPTVITCNIC